MTKVSNFTEGKIFSPLVKFIVNELNNKGMKIIK